MLSRGKQARSHRSSYLALQNAESSITVHGWNLGQIIQLVRSTLKSLRVLQQITDFKKYSLLFLSWLQGKQQEISNLWGRPIKETSKKIWPCFSKYRWRSSITRRLTSGLYCVRLSTKSSWPEWVCERPNILVVLLPAALHYFTTPEHENCVTVSSIVVISNARTWQLCYCQQHHSNKQRPNMTVVLLPAASQ